MKISFLPKSRLGIWTAGLSIFCIVISLVFYVFAELLKVITSDMLITMFGTSAIIAAIISFFTGVISIIKNKERSILVFIAIVVGFLFIAFIIGNILGLPDI